MSDFIKSNPFTCSVIFMLLVLTIFSFTVMKPFVESSVQEKDLDVLEQFNSKADILIRNDSIIMEELKNITL